VQPFCGSQQPVPGDGHWAVPLIAQPHEPATHAAPFGLPAQLTHTAPVEPQATPALPGWQVPPLAAEQQPPLHGDADEQLVEQVVPLHAVLSGQLDALKQPHMPLTHAWPFRLPLQFWHKPPGGPHTLPVLPRLQVPALQQPPLHGVTPGLMHMVVHTCVFWLQAFGAGQSVATEQPHVPPLPLPMQMPPLTLPGQLVHALPELPHAVADKPITHMPAEQQPPLHALMPGPHDGVHMCVVRLHALLSGQSLAMLQPHMPLTHWCPFALLRHELVHEPHWVGVLTAVSQPFCALLSQSPQPGLHAPE
jgi:hypothetical protein